MSQANIRLVQNDKFVGFHITGKKFEDRQRVRSRVRSYLSTRPILPLPDLPAKSCPLYGSVLKLRMAHDKIEKLERDVRAFITSERNCFKFEDDSESTHKLIHLVVGQPPDPTWDAVVGEISHNLRSALDIAVTQLSIKRTGRPKNPFYPIFVRGKTTMPKVNDFARKGTRLIKHLPLPYQQIIAQSQPFHAGNLRWHHPLWLLQCLNIADKHNQLTSASLAINQSTFQFLKLPSHLSRGIQINTGVPFEDGAVLGFFPKEAVVLPIFKAEVRFSPDCDAVSNEEVIEILRRIEIRVRRIICDLLSEYEHLN